MKRQAPRLTIIGDVGVDFVLGPLDGWPKIGTESLLGKSELRAGGSGGNTALAVSYLGAECRLISAIGNDDFGAWVSRQLQSLNTSLPVCNAPTSVSIGFIHSCGERTFFTTHGHLEKLSYEHVRPQLEKAPALPSIALLSGAFLTPQLRKAYPRLIDELAALGYQVALDSGWPSASWNEALREEVAQWVARCDHVLLNELEVAGLSGRDGSDAGEDVAALLRPGATLVVKAGARGAVGFENGARIDCHAEQFAVFDTIGAGDSFNAGYLLSRLNGGDLAEALKAGCNAAASIISHFPRRQIRPGELADRIAIPAVLALAAP